MRIIFGIIVGIVAASFFSGQLRAPLTGSPTHVREPAIREAPREETAVAHFGAPEAPTGGFDNAPSGVSQRQTASSPGGCRGQSGNSYGGSPIVEVAPGELISVQWYANDGQKQSVLEYGTYTPRQDVKIGAYWIYPNCDYKVVEQQAIASTGSVSSWTEGFTRVQQ